MDSKSVCGSCIQICDLKKYAQTQDELNLFTELEMFDQTKYIILSPKQTKIRIRFSSYVSHAYLTNHINKLEYTDTINNDGKTSLYVSVDEVNAYHVLNTILGLIKRRNKKMFRNTIRLYLRIMLWFIDTMDKSYAPEGPGYYRTMMSTLVGRT